MHLSRVKLVVQAYKGTRSGLLWTSTPLWRRPIVATRTRCAQGRYLL